MYAAQGVGTLKEVIVHCPGDELEILEPSNLKEYLFDALVDKDEAIDEHQEFTKTLEHAGVKVHRLVDLVKRVRSTRGQGFLSNVLKRLPNMFFTRDLAVVTSDGAIISSMRYPARCVEPAVIESILNELRVRILCEIRPPATLEGGDVLFLDKNTMLVGVGERTDEDGFEQVKEVWLKEGRTLVKVSILAARGSMHLDTVLGVMSKNCVCIHLPSIGKLTYYWIQGGDLMESSTSIGEFFAARGVTPIAVTSAEQFNMACNALMIEPNKKIICYDRSFKASLQALSAQNVELIALYLPQLFIGGGGPHCMILELRREEE